MSTTEDINEQTGSQEDITVLTSIFEHLPYSWIYFQTISCSVFAPNQISKKSCLYLTQFSSQACIFYTRSVFSYQRTHRTALNLILNTNSLKLKSQMWNHHCYSTTPARCSTLFFAFHIVLVTVQFNFFLAHADLKSHEGLVRSSQWDVWQTTVQPARRQHNCDDEQTPWWFRRASTSSQSHLAHMKSKLLRSRGQCANHLSTYHSKPIFGVAVTQGQRARGFNPRLQLHDHP